MMKKIRIILLGLLMVFALKPVEAHAEDNLPKVRIDFNNSGGMSATIECDNATIAESKEVAENCQF